MAHICTFPNAPPSLHLYRPQRVVNRAHYTFKSRHRQGVVLCRAVQHQPENPGGASAPKSARREMLALGSAVALGASSLDWGPALAASAVNPGYKIYERSNRVRFETSISSATRPYTLEIPDSWREDPVSLNDGKLYGVDLRFSNSSQGVLAVSVLPYGNRDSITEAGPPDKCLETFIELVGAFWSDNGFGDVARASGVVDTSIYKASNGQVYYQYELKNPHSLISANATDGQLYILNVSANSRQWKKEDTEDTLRTIVKSFVVPGLPV